jgi:hypothetical protein
MMNCLNCGARSIPPPTDSPATWCCTNPALSDPERELLKMALAALKLITKTADDNDDAPDAVCDGRLTMKGYRAAKAVLDASRKAI